MSRESRLIIPGAPHHVTHRGNRQGDVFFCNEDHEQYLRWLKKYAEKERVDILAYTLMSNHEHLIAVPPELDSLAKMLGPLHSVYAQFINKKYGWSGHLWQGRYFSNVLDDAHLWEAIRYVELNPVRAGIVCNPEDYAWSSAAAHMELAPDYILSTNPTWVQTLNRYGDWRRYLNNRSEEAESKLRTYFRRNLPCAKIEFVRELELFNNRELRLRPRGRMSRLPTTLSTTKSSEAA